MADVYQDRGDKWIGSSRLALAIVVSFGFFSLSALREGSFIWLKETQGLILSSIYWGGVITALPAGMIVTKYGGRSVFGITSAVSAVATLLIPIASSVSPYLVIALRFIIGICQGFAFPAGFGLWAAWAPPLERSRLTTISFAGTQFGTIVSQMVSGVLCAYLGWPSIFYIFGGLSCVWCVCWFIIVYDSPEEHPRISPAEKKYIQDSLAGQVGKTNKLNLKDVPWIEMVKSGPVWALNIGCFCYAWTYMTFVLVVPTYINEVLKIDIKSNGVLSSFSNAAMWIVIVLSGMSADIFIKRFPGRISSIRKAYFCTGSILASVFIIILGFLDCSNIAIALLFLIVGMAMMGSEASVTSCNQVDVAPKYASLLVGSTGIFFFLAGLLGQVIASIITTHQTRAEWQIFFYICAAISLFGALVYSILGSGEVQAWARNDNSEDNNDINDVNAGENRYPLLQRRSATKEEQLVLDVLENGTSLVMTISGLTSERDAVEEEHKVSWLGSSRVGLAFIVFFGFFNLYAMRVNMSVAVVCMVNQTAVKALSSENGTNDFQDKVNCSTNLGFGRKSSFEEGEYVWMKETQGLILSSFFWGYIATQLPGGLLAFRFGGKIVFGVCMAIAALGTLLSPVAATVSPYFLILVRVIVGLGEGVAFPAMNSIWAAWAPPLERSRLTSSSYAGMQIGTVVTLALSGVLCEFAEWSSIFYISGGICLVWCVLWFALVYNTPEDHPRISTTEKEYIQNSLHGQIIDAQKDLKIPWSDIVRSAPVWGLVVAHLSATWLFYTFLTNIPSYINDVLELDIKSNGVFSAITYVLMWLFITLTGIVSDFLRSKSFLSTTTIRKLMFSIGLFLPSVLVIALGFVDCSRTILALALLTAGVATMGCSVSVILCNHVDIAPRFSGILFGITNTFATMAGFVAPAVVGAVANHQSREEWQIVFYICAAIASTGAIIYLIIGSAEIQDWAVVDVTEYEDKKIQPHVNQVYVGEQSIETPVNTHRKETTL
ncbi:LOW QUALITY PROTEIN: uncharacterized protein LOC141899073 [Tubulanus polymorphus]|uniref:LOW QUALITY PROTEIN: uncharacterized protein LOC141899073 n=1 Tax=Tubulanus polymorphus TaxID=672921 RepID=UPI003DA52FE3